MFTGIPADAFDFYEELAADNTKAWWTENKARYEAHVREPVEALLTSLAEEFGPTAKIFRPYRDVRFSKDKTPYKTNLGATTTDKDGSVWYLALSPDGLYVGGGYYRMAKDQVAAFRAAVVDDTTGAALERVIATAEKAGFEVGGEQLKRVPPGFDKEHPRGRFLRHKGLYLGRQLDPAAWMGTRKAADRVAALWRDLRPVQAWLHAHVGPSTLPDR
ncbi:MAG TPA: DUF2461 domain-containing protein [Acidimicrobiales bacterium]|nr:DUF2461 domain-containing protein [Acidimicrobiales bacterium]